MNATPATVQPPFLANEHNNALYESTDVAQYDAPLATHPIPRINNELRTHSLDCKYVIPDI
jgi:hypothetical protein